MILIADKLRKIAKCLCQITDVGIMPSVDQVHGTITIDRKCPDHKSIGRSDKHLKYSSEDKVFDPDVYNPEWVAQMKQKYPGEPSAVGVYKKEDLYRHQNGIAAVVRDEDGKILVQSHVKFGFWTIPVGKCKEGQSHVEALKEELQEEAGISVKSYKKIGNMPQHYIRWGFPVDLDVAIFEVTEYGGEVSNKEPEKHSQQLFLDPNEIRSKGSLSDCTRYVLNLIKEV